MNSVSVTVERRHEANGKLGMCRGCALALATHEAGYPLAAFSMTQWWPDGAIYGANGLIEMGIGLPVDAQKLISDFDAGRAVDLPQTFVLPLERESA